jgi:hypothetical protein
MCAIVIFRADDSMGGDAMAMQRSYNPSTVGVRLPPRLKAWLIERADAEEMSVSTLVRTWIAREAKRDLQGSRAVVQGDAVD